jgi:hypothetical protein
MRLSAELFEQIVVALKSDTSSDRDKRLEPRVGMAGEATLVSLGTDGKRTSVRVRVRDVSHSGIGLHHHTHFALKHKFFLQLQSDGREPMCLVCVTAYCRRLGNGDGYSVGARISRVLKGEQVHKMEVELDRLQAQAKTPVTLGELSASDRARIDHISRAILS